MKLLLLSVMTEKLDDSKITGSIPPHFDKKFASNEELVDFAIEVDNVKK